MTAHPATGPGVPVPSPVVELVRRLLHALGDAAIRLANQPPTAPAAPAPPATVDVRLIYWGGPLDGDPVQDLEIRTIDATGPGAQVAADLVVRALRDRAVAAHELPKVLQFTGSYRTPDGDHGLVRFQPAETR